MQALGGAKNFVIVMPDADFGREIEIITESVYGCAGERCLAGSVLVPVGDAHAEARHRLVESARSLKVGDGRSRVSRGAGHQRHAPRRVTGYVQGVHEGARLVLDGRGVKVAGRETAFFVGPTCRRGLARNDHRPREMFGPVASIHGVKDLDEAIALMDSHANANATSIFSSCGKAPAIRASGDGVHGRREHRRGRAQAYFPFGGSRDSFFGDLKVHGRDAFEFYTDKKVTITRWF